MSPPFPPTPYSLTEVLLESLDTSALFAARWEGHSLSLRVNSNHPLGKGVAEECLAFPDGLLATLLLGWCLLEDSERDESLAPMRRSWGATLTLIYGDGDILPGVLTLVPQRTSARMSTREALLAFSQPAPIFESIAEALNDATEVTSSATVYRGGCPPIEAITSEQWWHLSSWGKTTEFLTGWDRRFAYTVGVQLARGRAISTKQLPICQRILLQAHQNGYSLPTQPK